MACRCGIDKLARLQQVLAHRLAKARLSCYACDSRRKAVIANGERKACSSVSKDGRSVASHEHATGVSSIAVAERNVRLRGDAESLVHRCKMMRIESGRVGCPKPPRIRAALDNCPEICTR